MDSDLGSSILNSIPHVLWATYFWLNLRYTCSGSNTYTWKFVPLEHNHIIYLNSASVDCCFGLRLGGGGKHVHLGIRISWFGFRVYIYIYIYIYIWIISLWIDLVLWIDFGYTSLGVMTYTCTFVSIDNIFVFLIVKSLAGFDASWLGGSSATWPHIWWLIQIL